jgi:hypothetical protein
MRFAQPDVAGVVLKRPVEPVILAVDLFREQHEVPVLGLGDAAEALEGFEIGGRGQPDLAAEARFRRITDVIFTFQKGDARVVDRLLVEFLLLGLGRQQEFRMDGEMESVGRVGQTEALQAAALFDAQDRLVTVAVAEHRRVEDAVAAAG